MARMTPVVHRTIRSRRRTLALQITEEGHLVVRAPRSLNDTQIRRFIEEKTDWIERKIRQISARALTAPAPLSPEEEKKLKFLARDAFIERSCLYAAKMDVSFEKIRLNSAKTRWGSCGPHGNLSFNWKLIQAPTEILDYVVVHELAHLIERNHSPRFWAKVAEFCPGYKSAKRWLKENKL